MPETCVLGYILAGQRYILTYPNTSEGRELARDAVMWWHFDAELNLTFENALRLLERIGRD